MTELHETFETRFQDFFFATSLTNWINVNKGDTVNRRDKLSTVMLEKTAQKPCSICVDKCTFYYFYLVLNHVNIGMLCFSVSDNKCITIIQVENLSIDPITRQREFSGVGSTLINCLIQLANISGCKSIIVNARNPISYNYLPHNQNLIQFFEYRGFIQTNNRDDFHQEMILLI